MCKKDKTQVKQTYEVFSYILYSYLMCSQAIDQNIFPKVLGTSQVFYCPKLRAIEHLSYSQDRRKKNLVYCLATH